MKNNNAADLLENISFDQLISEGPMDKPLVQDPPPADPPADPPPADPPQDPPTGGATDPPASPPQKDPPTDPPTPKLDKDGHPITDPPADPPPSDPPADPPGDEVTVIAQVQEAFGYEFEEGTTFENSIDGVVDYAKSAANEIAKEMVGNLMGQYPEAQELINHLANGNSVETFMKSQEKPAFADIEITEDNIDVQRQVMEMKLEASGFSKEEVKDFVDNLDLNGKLFAASSKALESMQTDYNASLEAQKESERKTNEANLKQAQKTWTEIEGMINGGKVGDFTIPQSKQSAFYDYLSKQDKNGATLRDVKNNELTLEQKLLIDYIIFSDFKVAGGGRVGKQDLNSLVGGKPRENRFKGANDPSFTTTPSKKGAPSELDNMTFGDFL